MAHPKDESAAEPGKMSAQQMRDYYRRVHAGAFARGEDEFSPVIHPGEAGLVNRFADLGHRQGMRNAFAFLEDRWGPLTGRAVLDLGCGRGRWSSAYASRGAAVTGVDISSEAIARLSAQMPQHTFLAADIAALDLPGGSFDVVNSVTVLQHMPEEQQRAVFRHIGEWLRPEGYLVMLENIADFHAPHVFPHAPEEWVAMGEAAGLQLRARWGSNHDLLFRMLSAVRSARPPGPGTGAKKGEPGGLSAHRPFTRSLFSAGKAAVALASFPVEWVCSRLPLVAPTHGVFLFQK